ncbi:MAG: hypothetical protein ABJC09_14750 [Terriglobia bacterium]
MIQRLLLFALASVTLIFASDATGTWQGELPGPDGNSYPMTFKLKADGAKLSGTMGGDQFEQPITEGEIKGDDITFNVHLEFNNGIDLKFTGKIGADKIDLTVQVADSKPAPFVVKKA